VTKVLIVDDHRSMCDSLAEAFGREPDFEVLPCLPSATLAAAYCAKLRPELVVMDVCTEGGASGLTAAEKLLADFPGIKVIVMSGFDEVTYVPRARAIGAQAFIYKTRSLASFIEAARTVLAGGTCFPEPKKIPVVEGELPLSDRELEVLRLRCRPMSVDEIASELFISPRTVKFHLDNIKGKTGFTDTREMLMWVLTNGWINPKY